MAEPTNLSPNKVTPAAGSTVNFQGNSHLATDCIHKSAQFHLGAVKQKHLDYSEAELSTVVRFRNFGCGRRKWNFPRRGEMFRHCHAIANGSKLSKSTSTALKQSWWRKSRPTSLMNTFQKKFAISIFGSEYSFFLLQTCGQFHKIRYAAKR